MFRKAFSATLTRAAETIQIRCVGKPGSADLERLQASIKKALGHASRPTAIELDLGNLVALDSPSLLQLSHVLRDVASTGVAVHLRHCRINLVECVVQFPLLVLFVRSVDLPFFCRSCQREDVVETEITHALVARAQQGHGCGRCARPMELDAPLELYEMLQAACGHAPTFTGAVAEPVDAPSLVGKEIPGQYVLKSLLGSGATGNVYLATQVSLDRLAAVKVVRADAGALEAYFRSEARAISRMSHPNIVSVYNFGELEGNQLYLSMEYVKGKNLRQVLADEPRMGLALAVEIARQCADALAYANANGVIHRDLKPENIMVAVTDEGPRVKILDFGLAALLEESRSRMDQLVGTPAYIAPEVWLGRAATSLSDQYSLGLLLHEMVSGRRAHPGPALEDYRAQHVGKAVGLASASRPEAAARLIDPIVIRMTDRSPEGRYPDMQAVVAELGTLSAQLGALVPLASMQIDHSGLSPLSAIQLGEPHPVTAGLVQELTMQGVKLQLPRPTDLDSGVPGLLLLAGSDEWRTSADALQARRGLVSTPVDAMEAAALDLIGQHAHIVVGRQRPEVIAAALRLMRNRGASPFDYLTRRGSQFLTLTASEYRGEMLDCVTESLRAHGLRERVVTQVTTICDELIINAMYHAPTTSLGVPRYQHIDRSVPVHMPPGFAPIVRWSLEDDCVALSVRDFYGSLTLAAVRTAIGRIGSRQVRPSTQAVGMGIGLPRALKGARVSVIRIVEKEYSEIVCLFDLGQLALTDEERTLCVLFDRAPEALEGPHEQQLGKKLTCHVVTDAEGPIVMLRGQLDETCDLRPLFARSSRRVDLGGVTRINSSGILRWLNARRQRPEVHLKFYACPSAFVDAIEAVEGFAMTGEVQSLSLPFYCERCKKESAIVTEVQHLSVPPGGDGLLHACQACSELLTLDREMPILP